MKVNHSTAGINFWNSGYQCFQTPFSFLRLENSAKHKEGIERERIRGTLNILDFHMSSLIRVQT